MNRGEKMEYVILGLLLQRAMTGYDISCFVRNNLSMICSGSAGSVQAALKKLVNERKLEYHECVENGKNKKTYQITKLGEEEFMIWVQNPMQISKVKNMELSKLFFMGFAEKEKRKESIHAYVEQLKETKMTLTLISEAIKHQTGGKIQDAEEEMSKYQLYTLQYGIDAAEFEMNWYGGLLSQMEEA